MNATRQKTLGASAPRLLACEAALLALVKRYCANLGTPSEFVSCITPRGPMDEWEAAKLALGLPAYRTGVRR